MTPLSRSALSAALLAACIGFAGRALADPDVPKAKLVTKLMERSAPAADGLLVPGWRAGKLHLGMTLAQLLQTMGDPDETYQQGYHFAWGGTYVWTNGEQVFQITVGWNSMGSDLRTTEGLGIGASTLAVIAALGEPEARDSSMGAVYLCYKRGIMFKTEDGRVSSIVIANEHRLKTLCGK